MPRYQVEIIEEAEQDARAIFLWIYRESPRAAADFALALDTAMDKLGESAHTWDAKKELKRYFINHYKVTLIYRLVGNVVTIGAVAHQRRRPDFWLKRSF